MSPRNNHKRRFYDSAEIDREALANRLAYGGNPVHKRNPGDFNLTPPAAPRPNKTLCDAADIFRRRLALDLLKAGVRKGLTSAWTGEGFPKHIWAVSANGVALEAKLDDARTGRYHGYPLLGDDPFSDVVHKAW
ncbi:hypothetical protein [Brevundimonas sp.]|uniref:hypothetical protein n=1 Tax=Brevundimonas sp. TaxID=1871086 RepID=UPI003D0C8BD1